VRRRYNVVLFVALLASLSFNFYGLYAQTDSQISTIATKSIQTPKKTIKPKLKKDASVIDKLKHAAQTGESLWLLLLLAFLAGIVTSFTPCIYPMIPITVGVLQAQGSKTFLHNLLSAICYVLGIAFVYAGLGYFAASASLLFGQWAANPWMVGFIVLFFMYLAFSMFGFYEIYIPGFLHRRGEVQTRGSLIKIFIFGMISGTVTSPCLTPALAILLAMVAKNANPLVGFFSLFFFALGMGILLVVVGVSSGVLNLLPRAGLWMVEVKRALGFLLIGMCVYFSTPAIQTHLTEYADTIVNILYAIVIGAAVLYVLAKAMLHMRRPKSESQ